MLNYILEYNMTHPEFHHSLYSSLKAVIVSLLSTWWATQVDVNYLVWDTPEMLNTPPFNMHFLDYWCRHSSSEDVRKSLYLLACVLEWLAGVYSTYLAPWECIHGYSPTFVPVSTFTNLPDIVTAGWLGFFAPAWSENNASLIFQITSSWDYLTSGPFDFYIKLMRLLIDIVPTALIVLYSGKHLAADYGDPLGHMLNNDALYLYLENCLFGSDTFRSWLQLQEPLESVERWLLSLEEPLKSSAIDSLDVWGNLRLVPLYSSDVVFVCSSTLNVVLIVLFVLIGGILPLYERKYLALTQSSVGPNFVGYNGRLQFLADALKVLWNEYIVLYNTNNLVFFLLPIMYLNLNLLFFLNIHWAPNLSLSSLEYNLLFFLFLELFLHILIVMTGFYLNNNYTLIAANSLVNIMFSLEVFTVLLFTLLLFILNSFSFEKVFASSPYLSYVTVFTLLIPSILLFFLIETAKTPFDIVEAETEVIMGYHVEYSGFLFGLFVLAEYFHVLVSLYTIVIIFF